LTTSPPVLRAVRTKNKVVLFQFYIIVWVFGV
jgi:hypothetical protein